MGLLAIWVDTGQFCLGPMWAAHKEPFGPPTWGHMWPYGLPVWGTDGSLLGPRWVPRVSPIWAPCGPPGQFCQGPMWAAHRGPFGPPSWGPSVARMDCPCGAQMGPWWGPDGSHVYRPNGPIVAPLANSAWAAHNWPVGPPSWGPHVARMEPRWVHGGARMGPTCIARMGPLWPPGQFCVGPTWAAHNCPYGPPSRGPPVARMGCPCRAQMGPWWGPDGSHVYRPNGPLVAPLANSA